VKELFLEVKRLTNNPKWMDPRIALSLVGGEFGGVHIGIQIWV
jgi:hypothetical protein